MTIAEDGYFDCLCCGTVDMGAKDDPAFCEACLLCECGEDSPECKELMIDGAAGIYVPKEFAARFLADRRDWEAWGISQEDTQVLLTGPEHAEYFETWADIEGRVERDWNGKRWVLTQDGDLWAQCVGPAAKKGPSDG